MFYVYMVILIEVWIFKKEGKREKKQYYILVLFLRSGQERVYGGGGGKGTLYTTKQYYSFSEVVRTKEVTSLYELYSLNSKCNPQLWVGLLPRSKIHVVYNMYNINYASS